MGFDGMRVLALESRRAEEMAELIRRQGGVPLVAPSMREVPLEENAAVFRFAEGLLDGEFDMVILLTGVGTRQLQGLVAARYGAGAFAAGLRKVTIVARGPKPAAALREMALKPALVAPEPNTWREVLAVTEGRPERRIAVQEYGRTNPDLIQGLEARGASVATVRVYQWALPEDAEPLRAAARELAAGKFEAILFTTAVQVDHLLRVAEEQGLAEQVVQRLGQMFVASIGPTTSEALEEFGVRASMEPSHPKMGFLVKEAGERIRRKDSTAP